jgi:hypothetical protein
MLPTGPVQPVHNIFTVNALRLLHFHGLEEVIGSITIRSTNKPFKFIKLSTYTPTGYTRVLVSISLFLFCGKRASLEIVQAAAA